MGRQDQQNEDEGRWACKAAGLVAAGGVAILGRLIASIFEQVPNYVPLAGAASLVFCNAWNVQQPSPTISAWIGRQC